MTIGTAQRLTFFEPTSELIFSERLTLREGKLRPNASQKSA